MSKGKQDKRAAAETTELTGWGRYPRVRVARVEVPADATELHLPPPPRGAIARGAGRSYGNAALLTDGIILLTERLRRVISFDHQTGRLRAEAGLTLAEIVREFAPQGWFPAVTPGTKFVTLGGAVAADVHGKNHHHAGTFGAHVSALQIKLADESLLECAPEGENAELFWATVGGMGLTGVITEVECALRPVETPYIVVQNTAARNLEESLALLTDAAWEDEYTVAWIDALARGGNLGRGILLRGHHATRRDVAELAKSSALTPRAERHFNIPFDFPSFALNSWTVAAFNHFYYRRQSARHAPYLAHYEDYFYPLDWVENWNRLYGRRGFVQYQCVLPPATAHAGLRLLLEKLSASRRASFLAVLKRFGAEGAGLLSFPQAGYTLALDLPVRHDGLFELLDELDEIVLQHGGRVYLAKDARVSSAAFRRMYPRLDEWQRIKHAVDPDNRFRSDLSEMLQLNGA